MTHPILISRHEVQSEVVEGEHSPLLQCAALLDTVGVRARGSCCGRERDHAGCCSEAAHGARRDSVGCDRRR